MKQFVVVSYDIPADRRRLKVMKTLKNFGTHVQYSVFECRLKTEELDELRKQLKKLVGKHDSVRFYFISADDVSRIEVMGQGQVTADSLFYLH
jgi:CRISPR-associated protein Cas2